jgi:hypothetical protein
MNKIDTYNHIIKCLESVNNIIQLEAIYNMINNYINKFGHDEFIVEVECKLLKFLDGHTSDYII